MLRRRFLHSAAALPFLGGLTSLAAPGTASAPRQRLIFVFSPNGIVPPNFWPEKTGADFDLKPILQPLAPFKNKLLIIKGLSNKLRGDGDGHQRGMSCLLTGIELAAGNIMGGSGQPAGWAKGPSIDQVIKERLQASPATRTRFGSLEFGVCVPDRADPWTRWVYAGANKPVAPISNPYQMMGKLYGQMKDRAVLTNVLDDVAEDLKRARALLSPEDRTLLDEHTALVQDMERSFKEDSGSRQLSVSPPRLEENVSDDNDAMPKLSRMQIDLLVSALANDMARVATLQFTASVGGAKMRWLGIDQGHHELSHDPDLNVGSQEKLTKIDTWFASEVAYLAQRLAAQPEPSGAGGSMLDHTLIVWTNELGKGNSHSLDDIPFICIGKAPGLPTGQSLTFKEEPHNRLLLSLARSMGTELATHGNPSLCAGGALL